jgi:YVTN family beta-propeller protein
MIVVVQRVRTVLAMAVLLAAAPALAQTEFAAERIKTSDTTFFRPHDLVLSPDRRLLYVTDMGNDVVKVLDPNTLAVVGTIGAGELNSPHDAVFDSDGRLYVADTGNDRIAVFSVQGESGFLLHSLRRDLSGPEGVDFDVHGKLYVTNASGDNLVVFDGGAIVDRIGKAGEGENEYDRPHDIEVYGNRIFVVDAGNDRIQVLDQLHKHRKTLSGTDYDFKEPKYLAVDAVGCLLVADQHHDIVKVFDSNLKLLGIFASGRRGNGPDELDRPEGVETWMDLIWISDTYNNRIVLYRRTKGPEAKGTLRKPC